MNAYHAPAHAGMRYPAFVEPDAPHRLRAPEPSSTVRVDDQLVRPETREEVVRGRRIHAAPAKAAHADRHQMLGVVTEGCIAPGYVASTDLLTRAGSGSDFATDTCVRREGIDPHTGARYLEELAFEIVNEQSRRDITERAQDLSARGVRRIVAVFVKRGEVCEWSSERNDWIVLDPTGVLEDPTLAEPLPVRAMLDRSEATRAAIRAFHAKGHPEMRAIESRAEQVGRAKARVEVSRTAIEALCDVLEIQLGPDRRAHLLQLDAPQLESLLGHLRRNRRWPA